MSDLRGFCAFDDAEVCFGCLHRYGEEFTVRTSRCRRCCRRLNGAIRPTPSCGLAEPKALPRDAGRGGPFGFELLGYAPVMEADGREGGGRAVPAERRGGRGWHGGRRVPRGTHARDAPSENRASASAAGRS